VADIDFKLKARNSSGEQTLHLTSAKGEKEFWFTLCGEYGGKPIQIDFDIMTRADLEDLSVAMQMILDET
jgi:hypothetical protein